MQRVKLNKGQSQETFVKSGVPQGSMLGLLLFNIFVEDIINGIQSKVRIFADNCVVYRHILNKDDKARLQGDLNIIGD